ncbi:hypothetical protein Aab01nite_61710 [Paractinoplanes abujensis]|nr:hypothetical protein Aab01nite_61710 [Actinoplanes abujensis]
MAALATTPSPGASSRSQSFGTAVAPSACCCSRRMSPGIWKNADAGIVRAAAAEGALPAAATAGGGVDGDGAGAGPSPPELQAAAVAATSTRGRARRNDRCVMGTSSWFPFQRQTM